MLDLIEMWKKPKMIAYMLLTAVLYPALLYPFQQYSFFSASADYLRVGVGIPAAFSFLFGPAAAWGTAFGNLIFDATTGSGLNVMSIFGFIGNFLIGYIPYKLWSALTTEKPDLRSPKKVALFVGLSALACTLCGLVIAWGLLYLYSLPFIMMTFTIAATDALWAIVLGSIILAASYGFVSRRRLLYTDVLGIAAKSSWSKPKNVAILVFAVSTILCFVIPVLFSVEAVVLLPFVVVSVIAVVATCK